MVRWEMAAEVVVAERDDIVLVPHSKGIDVVFGDVLNPKFFDHAVLHNVVRKRSVRTADVRNDQRIPDGLSV